MARLSFRCFLVVLLVAAGACEVPTDATTRIAFDIEKGERMLGREEGARFTIRHLTPSREGECTGPYMVQIDKVGALIIWCRDGAGNTVSSHSTTYHSRFTDTPETWILEKPAGEALLIDLVRRNGRAHVAAVR
jgi:hypothetical protein